jgi:hypothetical protein
MSHMGEKSIQFGIEPLGDISKIISSNDKSCQMGREAI